MEVAYKARHSLRSNQLRHDNMQECLNRASTEDGAPNLCPAVVISTSTNLSDSMHFDSALQRGQLH